MNARKWYKRITSILSYNPKNVRSFQNKTSPSCDVFLRLNIQKSKHHNKLIYKKRSKRKRKREKPCHQEPLPPPRCSLITPCSYLHGAHKQSWSAFRACAGDQRNNSSATMGQTVDFNWMVDEGLLIKTSRAPSLSCGAGDQAPCWGPSSVPRPRAEANPAM